MEAKNLGLERKNLVTEVKDLVMREMELVLKDKDKQTELVVKAMERVIEGKDKEMELKIRGMELTVELELRKKENDMKLERMELQLEKKELEKQLLELQKEFEQMRLNRKEEEERNGMRTKDAKKKEEMQMIHLFEKRINFMKSEELSLNKQANDAVLLPGAQMPLYGILIAGISLVFPYQDTTRFPLVFGVIFLLFCGFCIGMIPPFCISYKTVRKLAMMMDILLEKSRNLTLEMEQFESATATLVPSAAAAGFVTTDLMLDLENNAPPPLVRSASVLAAFHSLMAEAVANLEGLSDFTTHFNRMLIIQLGSALTFSIAIPVITTLICSKFSLYLAAANMLLMVT